MRRPHRRLRDVARALGLPRNKCRFRPGPLVALDAEKHASP